MGIGWGGPADTGMSYSSFDGLRSAAVLATLWAFDTTMDYESFAGMGISVWLQMLVALTDQFFPNGTYITRLKNPLHKITDGNVCCIDHYSHANCDYSRFVSVLARQHYEPKPLRSDRNRG